MKINLLKIEVQKITNTNELKTETFIADFIKYNDEVKICKFLEKKYQLKKICTTDTYILFVGVENDRNIYKIDRHQLSYRVF